MPERYEREPYENVGESPMGWGTECAKPLQQDMPVVVSRGGQLRCVLHTWQEEAARRKRQAGGSLRLHRMSQRVLNCVSSGSSTFFLEVKQRIHCRETRVQT